MKRITKNKASQIVFSRLSRKNYAIFNSLGKHIKISKLARDICNLSLKKSLSTGLSFNIITQTRNEEEDSDLKELIFTLPPAFLLEVLGVLEVQKLSVSHSPFSYNKTKIYKSKSVLHNVVHGLF